MRNLGLVAIAAAIGFGGVCALQQTDTGAFAAAAIANCDIKGNVSIDTGEHIYHVPGQMFYADTVIDPQWGERWFCSEADARSAGWRKSRR